MSDDLSRSAFDTHWPTMRHTKLRLMLAPEWIEDNRYFFAELWRTDSTEVMINSQ